MSKNFIKKIIIPKNLKINCQHFNNGYIIWLATNFHATPKNSRATFKYLVKALNKNHLNINYNKTNIGDSISFVEMDHQLRLMPSLFKQTQCSHKLIKNSNLQIESKYLNVLRYQLNQSMLNVMVTLKAYLVLRGVGYKFWKKEQYLSLKVGYSHILHLLIQSYMDMKFNKKSTKLKITTTNLFKLKSLLAFIRKYKQPDVYKGKGIRYIREKVMIKEGKKKKSF